MESVTGRKKFRLYRYSVQHSKFFYDYIDINRSLLVEESHMRRMNYKTAVVSVLTASMLLSGCGAATAPESADTPVPEMENTVSESAGSVEAVPEDAEDAVKDPARIYAKGPYGRISVVLPEDWVYQAYSANSDHSIDGSYGMWIRPADEDSGYVDLFYMQMFAVCGTGLEQETVTIAGDEASIGTYDNHEMWDFINFRGINEGVTAQSVMAEDWTEEDREAVLKILETLEYEPDNAEGAVSYFKSDSEIPEIGVIAEAHDITSSGATVRFRVWDPGLASGELEYGDDYSLEKLEGEEWISVPVIFEGEFNDIAYIIPKEADSPGSEWEVNWEWLYGSLEPGDYRICKTVMDFRGTGDYDTYKIYVYFHYAGGENAEDGETADQGVWISPVSSPVEIVAADGASLGNENTQEQGGVAQMQNPFKNYDSLAEAEEAASVSVSVPEVIEESSNRVYRAIPGELLEVIYYDESENEVARIRKAQGTERIDGNYSEYNTATDIDAEKYAAELLGKGEMVNVITIQTQENGMDFVTSVTFRGKGVSQSAAMLLINELAGVDD